MKHCQRYEALISAAVDGELGQAQRAELMEHLAACPACREVYGEMMAMHEAFSELDTEVPGDLAGDVMAKVRSQGQVKKPWHHWRQAAVAAAACCVLAFLGYPYLLGEMTPADTAEEAALYSAADQEAEGSPNRADEAGRAAAGSPAVSAQTAAAPAPPATDAPESGGSDSGAAAAGQEMMDDVLTYFRSGVSQEAAAAQASDGEEALTEAAPCPILSSSDPEMEAWMAEHIQAEGYSTGDGQAEAWLLTLPEYEALTAFLVQQGIAYDLEGEAPPAQEETQEGTVCVVYLAQEEAVS